MACLAVGWYCRDRGRCDTQGNMYWYESLVRLFTPPWFQFWRISAQVPSARKATHLGLSAPTEISRRRSPYIMRPYVQQISTRCASWSSSRGRNPPYSSMARGYRIFVVTEEYPIGTDCVTLRTHILLFYKSQDGKYECQACALSIALIANAVARPSFPMEMPVFP